MHAPASLHCNTEAGAVAAIYHWKGKPVKPKEYNRNVLDIAEPIDRDAEEHGRIHLGYDLNLLLRLLGATASSSRFRAARRRAT